ncbi:hypothetical protein HDE_06759 [Halotydeus destructor]|nr:hypothetical protein HDE_06759 [Halotydeus destructor]
MNTDPKKLAENEEKMMVEQRYNIQMASLLNTSSPKIKMFTGDQRARLEVDEWIKKFEAAAVGLPDATKLNKLVGFLSGNAADWHEVYVADAEPAMTYVAVVRAMKDYFTANNDRQEIKRNMETYKQEEDQLGADYITTKLRLIKRYNSAMKSEEKVDMVISGLRPILRQAMFARNPANIEELHRLVHQHEKGLKSVSEADDNKISDEDSKEPIKEMARAVEQLAMHSSSKVHFRREVYPRPPEPYGSLPNQRGNRDEARAAYSSGNERNGYQDSNRNWSQGRRDYNGYGNNADSGPIMERQWNSNQRGAGYGNRYPTSSHGQASRPAQPWNSDSSSNQVKNNNQLQDARSSSEGKEQPTNNSSRTNTGRIKCYKCGGGHFARFCPENPQTPPKVGVNILQAKTDDALIESFGGVNMLEPYGNPAKQAFRGRMIRTTATVDGIKIVGLVNTGSTATCLSNYMAEQLALKLEPFKGPQLAAVNGEDVNPKGQAEVVISIKDNFAEATIKLLVLIIENLNVDLLLGNDFNEPAGVLVDCKERVIRLQPALTTATGSCMQLSPYTSDYIDLMARRTNLLDSFGDCDVWDEVPITINMMRQNGRRPAGRQGRPTTLPIGQTRQFVLALEDIVIEPGAEIYIYVEALGFDPDSSVAYRLTRTVES